jgi:hemoglobin
MFIVKRIALACVLVATLAVTAAAQAPNTTTEASMASGVSSVQEKRSLYARLGGYDAIAAVVDDFIGRLVADKTLTKFFAGHSEDSLKKIRMHVIDQLCAAAGGPCLYVGRDMKTSHHGLGITSADWDASANHLGESLDHFKVPKPEKDEVMAFVATLKKDIVDK